MLKVLCFDCGAMFEVSIDTASPTKQCPKCKDK
jgi:DNA-directed RNA polymerase subunit RPC12/RpoP